MKRLILLPLILLAVDVLGQTASITVTSDEAVAGITVTRTGIDSYTITLASSALAAPHAPTHSAAGSDPITISQSQVTNLATDLASKLPKSGGTMTGALTLTGGMGALVVPNGASIKIQTRDGDISLLNSISNTIDFTSTVVGAGNYADISARRFISNVTPGTAPFVVGSSTLVTGLNADMVDSQHIPAPGASGNVMTSNGNAWVSQAINTTQTQAATFSLDGIQTVRTGQLRWYPPAACTLVSCMAAVGTAPTGSSIQVDVNKNGVSVLASPLSIAAGANTSSVTTPTTTAMTATDYLTVDVDSIGSTEPGRDLTVRIIYTIP